MMNIEAIKERLRGQAPSIPLQRDALAAIEHLEARLQQAQRDMREEKRDASIDARWQMRNEADELRGEIARLHGAVCQAVALLNRADFGRSAEVVKAYDILREALVSHADECEDCHAKAGTVCADSDCHGRRAQDA